MTEGKCHSRESGNLWFPVGLGSGSPFVDGDDRRDGSPLVGGDDRRDGFPFVDGDDRGERGDEIIYNLEFGI